MIVYTSMRLAQALVTLLVASFVVFALSHASGNPVDVMLPREASLEERQAFIEVMGLDRPMIVQYGDFLVRAVQGDFGTSIRTREPASVLVFERIAPSMKLATVALVFTLLMSIPLGVLAAIYRERWVDKVAMLIALSGQAMPAFWIGPMAVLVFSVWLGWLPTSGMGSWKHYILPSIVLGWGISAGIVRLLRSTMLEVLDSEYIKLARSKGLSERTIVWKHALRNALIPVVTLVGMMYGVIVTGVVIVEVVFAWPGLGRLGYEAVMWRDFPVLQLTVLLFVATIIFVNFLVDLSYGIIDPRVRIVK